MNCYCPYLKYNRYSHYAHEQTVSENTFKYVKLIWFAGIELIEYLQVNRGYFLEVLEANLVGKRKRHHHIWVQENIANQFIQLQTNQTYNTNIAGPSTYNRARYDYISPRVKYVGQNCRQFSHRKVTAKANCIIICIIQIIIVLTWQRTKALKITVFFTLLAWAMGWCCRCRICWPWKLSTSRTITWYTAYNSKHRQQLLRIKTAGLNCFNKQWPRFFDGARRYP